MTARPSHITRRAVLAGGGALVVSFQLPARARDTPAAGSAAPRLDEGLVGAWLRIEASGQVRVFTGKVEIGQGIGGALAQIAAEELDVAFEDVTVTTGDTGVTPNEGYTFGSVSVQQSGSAIGNAAAEARLALRELAAERWGVPLDAVEAAAGVLQAGERRMPYGEAVGNAVIERTVSEAAPRKDPSAYRVVGRSLPRPDLPGKVFGAESFVQDLRLPGMAFGRVVRPPTLGGALVEVDVAQAEATPGVLAVVRDGSFLGVVAAREEVAVRAADALRADARWSDAAPVSLAGDISAMLAALPHDENSLVRTERLDAQEDAQRVSARYERPFQAHASMGPSAAVALWEDDRLTVWSHSQGPFPLRAGLAEAFGVAPGRVRVIHREGAGCYGHNGADDAAMDAAMLARATPGRPVKLQWSRADEFQWEPYGTAMVMDAEAGLDAAGAITSWSYAVTGLTNSSRPGGGASGNFLAVQQRQDSLPALPPRNIPQPNGGLDRNALPLYDLPGQDIRERFVTERPVRTSSLRGLGAYGNVFAIESFMDELALAAGADPIAFRLDHLSEPRIRAVIEATARAADWTARAGPSGDGRGRGCAFSRYKNSGAYYAAVAEVGVDRESGRVRLERIVGAVDCGLVINPDGVRNQIEGGAVQSTSWTLLEEARFAEGRSSASDWVSYPILGFRDVPPIETVLVDRPEQPSLGVGEAAQGPVAAAIANAVFDAIGVRLRRIPLTPERVLAALSEAD